MKTKFIEKQFNESTLLQDAVYNEETKQYYLPKRTEKIIEKNKVYIVELDDKLLVNNGDPVLQTNWNKNKIPTEKYYKIDVINIIGKMIRVVGIGYDITTNKDLSVYWDGYLPKDKINIMEEL